LNFTLLHNHSHYSLPFDGYSTIQEIIQRAKELNMTTLALTDHGTMSGCMEFYKECKKAGIKPILGEEFYFIPDKELKQRGYHLILLAKNDVGKFNLNKLDSLAVDNFYYRPRITPQLLEQYHEGIICLSACIAGPLNSKRFAHFTKQLHDIFKDDFYLEIQPNSMSEQKAYNKRLVKLSRIFNIPMVVTTDSHYVWKYQADDHRKWIGNNKEDKGYFPTDEFYMMSEDEVRQGLISQGLPKHIIDNAIENTGLIADQCEVKLEVEGNHYPVFPTDDPLESVKEICRKGWVDKIVNKVPKYEHQDYLTRFLSELPILEKMKYLNYLLIVEDLLSWCKNNDITIGPGRGSCGGSLGVYMMDITKVDPIKYDLQFSRFVNENRVSPCDIDIDVSQRRREEVIEYLRQKYGHVYHARTCNYLGAKSAAERAAKALGYEHSEVLALKKDIDSLDEIKGYPDVVELAKKFEGRIVSYGCHASAVIVFQDDPNLYTPIERQEDTINHCHRMVTAYDYVDLESDMNILKLDILGLANLDIVDDTVKMLPEPIDYFHLDPTDSEVFKIYANGFTQGVFQASSNGMRGIAKGIEVDRFEDIVALVALYRPGPLKSGMVQEYIDCKHGKVPEYPHQDLEQVLKDTYGVMLYQEQTTAIVQLMAGMTQGEADLFRYIIGKKKVDKMGPAIEEFVKRSVAKGYSEEVAQNVAKWLSDAAEYIFNKSHSVEYGYLSYVTAYLKVKHPVEFMCASLNNKIGNIDKTVEFIREGRRMGIKILPPSVAYSKPKYTIENGSIRFGLNAIKGVGSTEFASANSFDEFMTNNPNVNKGTLEALIKAGAFPESRGLNLAKLVWLQTEGAKLKKAKEKLVEYEAIAKTPKDDKELKKALRGISTWKPKLAKIQPFDNQPLVVNEPQLEREVLGMYLTTSPMNMFVEQLTTNTWTWDEFVEASKDQKVIVGGMIKKIKLHTDKRGKQMAFVELECYMGETIDITFFASVWEVIGEKLHEDGIIRVEGKKGDGNKMLGNSVGVYR
jgi:DNA polymerase-3 subunit alpha